VAIVESLLSKDPARRPSARELVTLLQASNGPVRYDRRTPSLTAL
jgi:hypothetical protein